MITLDPLEVACGAPLGRDRELAPPRRRELSMSAGGVLEALVLEALRRPPCVVAFSGGRDSSAILAVAVDLARRQGLPPPIPVTLRFPGRSATEESTWQELVLDQLGVDEWERIVVGDDHGVVGPLARRCLEHLGVCFPGNAFSHLAMAERAPGGSLLSGAGGDEVLGSVPSHLVRALTGRVRPHRGDAVELVDRLRPGRARRLGERVIERVPWLTEAAWQEAVRREGEAQRWYGSGWGRQTRRWTTSRYAVAARTSLAEVCALGGTVGSAPFLDPAFIGALGRDGGAGGFEGRSRALRHLVGDLLPDDVLRRRSKAVFDAVFFDAEARAFAADWDGRGFDPAVVDADALRANWAAPEADGRAKLLLQTLAVQAASASSWRMSTTPSTPSSERGRVRR